MKPILCILLAFVFGAQGMDENSEHSGHCGHSGHRWTKWLNRDRPSVTGDWETVDRFSQTPCNGKAVRMEVRLKSKRSITIASVTERITVSPDNGIQCAESSQPGIPCFFYSAYRLLPGMMKKFDGADPTGGKDGKAKTFEPSMKIRHYIYWHSDDQNYGLVYERLELGPRYGLLCKKAHQPDNTCSDYEVRFLCPLF